MDTETEPAMVHALEHPIPTQTTDEAVIKVADIVSFEKSDAKASDPTLKRAHSRKLRLTQPRMKPLTDLVSPRMSPTSSTSEHHPGGLLPDDGSLPSPTPAPPLPADAYASVHTVPSYLPERRATPMEAGDFHTATIPSTSRPNLSSEDEQEWEEARGADLDLTNLPRLPDSPSPSPSPSLQTMDRVGSRPSVTSSGYHDASALDTLITQLKAVTETIPGSPIIERPPFPMDLEEAPPTSTWIHHPTDPFREPKPHAPTHLRRASQATFLARKSQAPDLPEGVSPMFLYIRLNSIEMTDQVSGPVILHFDLPSGKRTSTPPLFLGSFQPIDITLNLSRTEMNAATAEGVPFMIRLTYIRVRDTDMDKGVFVAIAPQRNHTRHFSLLRRGSGSGSRKERLIGECSVLVNHRLGLHIIDGDWQLYRGDRPKSMRVAARLRCKAIFAIAPPSEMSLNYTKVRRLMHQRRWHLADTILHQGMLAEWGGDVKFWRNRYFEIRGARLHAYSEMDGRPLMWYDLRDLREVWYPRTKAEGMEFPSRWAFKCRFVDGNELHFYARSLVEADGWMEALAGAVDGSVRFLSPWLAPLVPDRPIWGKDLPEV